MTCRVLNFSRVALHKWRTNPISARDLVEAYLTDAGLDLHGDNPELGYRIIADDCATPDTRSATTESGGYAHSSACGRCTPGSMG